MDTILQVKGLCKKYEDFALDHVSFTLPRGCIMGFIGENGAGKSTTMKAILNLIRRDEGDIQIFGKDNIQNELEVKEKIGVVFDTMNLPEMLWAQDVGKMMRSLYRQWDPAKYAQYLEQFELPAKKNNQGFFPRYENETRHRGSAFSQCSAAVARRSNQRIRPHRPGRDIGHSAGLYPERFPRRAVFFPYYQRLGKNRRLCDIYS